MRLRAVGIVALVVLSAGCSGFVGGDSDAATVTPAEVPTVEPTPSDPRVGVAPGVSASGVTNPGFLAQRHTAAANETSYVWRMQYRDLRTSADTTANVSRVQRIVVENETTYRRDATSEQVVVDGQRTNRYDYSVYANGRTEYRSWIASRSEGRVFRAYDAPTGSSEYAGYPTANIALYLDLETATVARHDVAGSDAQHYLVTGTRDSLPSYESVSNYSARAVVRGDGFVRELRVEFDGVRGGTPVSVRYEFKYTDVGTATVTPPDWYDEARATLETGSDGG